MNKYIEVKENPDKITHLRAVVRYNLGGMNFYNYKMEERGYYLSVYPVEVGKNFEMSGFPGGVKKFVLPVTRKSASAESKAERIAEEEMKDLVEHVLKATGLELKNPEVA